MQYRRIIHARPCKKAITFIELILVIAILAVLIGLGAPRFRGTFENLQLSGTARQLQAFMNFLSQRAIVERKIFSLFLDNEEKRYWAQAQGESEKLKSFRFSREIILQPSDTEVLFYPDGSIDPVDITITSSGNKITLTTKGVFGNVKIQAQE